MSDWKKLISDAKELLDIGAITDAEFEEAKQKAFALRDGPTTQPLPPSDIPNLDDMGTRIHSPSSATTNPLPDLDDMGTMMGNPNTLPPGFNTQGAIVGSNQPETIGSYRIVELLGQGGMGSVYKGRHKNDQVAEARGDVAIKMIHPTLAKDEDFKARFVKEGLFGMSLQHPNIANVIDVVDDGGVLALLMDFVEGQELKELIPPRGMPIQEVVNLLKPIASALDYLHEKGIVHRDMKPANIRVRPDGMPVILDFGIAKDTNEADSGMTQTGTAMGTQTYMAPEQMDAKNVTGAADQYALAMMAYQMLSGQLPWEESLSSARITIAKMMGQLTVLDITQELSNNTASVVMKGLSLRPNDRYSTCVNFVDALKLSASETQSDSATPKSDPSTVPMSSISLKKESRSNVNTETGQSATVQGTSTGNLAKEPISKDQPTSKEQNESQPKSIDAIAASVQTATASSKVATPESTPESPKNNNLLVIAAMAVVGVLCLVFLTLSSDEEVSTQKQRTTRTNVNSKGNAAPAISSKWSQFSNVEFFQTLESTSDVKTKLRSICQQDEWYMYSNRELKLLRNAFFAIRGRQFKTDFIREYFSDSNWYTIDYSYSDERVTFAVWEKNCIKAIKRNE